MKGMRDDFFFKFAEAAPYVLWTVRSGGELEFWNARWREVTGAVDADSLSKNWSEWVHPDERATWQNLRNRNEAFEQRFRLWSREHGIHRWQLGRAQPFCDDKADIIRWVCTCHDIHDQIAAQDAQRIDAARLKALVDNLPVGVVISDPNGQPVYWNAKLAELRGLQMEAATWMHAVHPQDRERVLNSWNEAISKGEHWSEIYRFVHPDGLITWVSGRANCISSSDGELLGFVRTLEDISELKAIEQKLQESNQQLQMHAGLLEREVRLRTEKLREAQVELDKLSYAIVHDMRAPLRTVAAFSKILLEEYTERLDDQGKDLLKRMTQAVNRQDRLIQDVLAYHNYVRADFLLTPVSLDQVVTGLLETYANFQPPHAEIEVKRPLGWVTAHETLLTQCISALLNNAVKFVAPGVRPQIRIWAECTSSSVTLWVQDNGIGIGPEHHSRIFNIFETLHQREHFPGTGIGLPLAKKAMERMGGEIGVTSAVGKGSSFWLRLNSIISEKQT